MHILFLILKILGILLLCILGLLLFLILLFLFVPVRYHIQGAKGETQTIPDGTAKISFLLNAVGVEAIWKEKKLQVILHILFIKRYLAGAPQSITTSESNPKEKSKSASNDIPKNKDKETAVIKARDDEVKVTDSIHADPVEPEPIEPETIEAKQTQKKKFRILEKVRGIFRKLKKAVASFQKTWENIKRYLEFLLSDMTKSMLHKLKYHLAYLWKHFRPRRLRGQVQYGFDDPSLTGGLTGIGYLLIPQAGDSFSLLPDFENEILQFEATLTGHIRLCHVLKTGWQVFFDKEIRNYIKKVNYLRRNR